MTGSPSTTERPRFDDELAAAPVYAAHGERAALLGSRCASCGATAFPRRTVCLECGGAHAPRELSGRGTVHAAATVGNPPAGFSAGYRYVCVDLDDGPRVLGPCLDDGVERGARVEAVPAPVRDDEDGFRFRELADA